MSDPNANDDYVPEMSFVDEGESGNTPQNQFTAYEPDVEIVDPSELEEQDRQDFDEIKNALKQTQEELKTLKGGQVQGSQDPNQANVIAQAIKEAIAANKQQPQKERKTPGQLAEEINSEFYDKGPYETMLKFQRETMGPVLDQATGQILALQRQLLEVDPKRSSTYQRYREEIDREVMNLTPEQRFYDSGAYQKAHDRVISRHQEEVMGDKLQEMLKEELKKMGITPNQAESATSSPPQKRTSFNETVQNPGRPGGKKRKVALTPQEKQFAFARGLTEAQYADWKSRNNMS